MERAMAFKRILDTIGEIHINLEIDEQYKQLSSWIALEKADSNKDWLTFEKIYLQQPSVFAKHISNTWILDYNILKDMDIDFELVVSSEQYDRYEERVKHQLGPFLKNKHPNHTLLKCHCCGNGMELIHDDLVKHISK